MSPPRKTELSRSAPRGWHRFHVQGCGSQVRGCMPTCPKDVYERTGRWIGPHRWRVALADGLARLSMLARRSLNGKR